jgi:hypothetical protein
VVAAAAGNELQCGGSRAGDYQSPVAVDAGAVACAPSAAYALACWNGPTATTALCLQDPWQRQVVQIKSGGRLAAQQAPRQPTPLGIVLSDGSRCLVRDGGAWTRLDGHPELSGTYSCAGGTAVWAATRSDGIDRSHSLWSVRVAPMSGHGQLRTLTVRTAYFVGTSHS